MILRIRFHGRGGHGMKTASRVLGTAAFLSGFHCQDSPVYGAERRGAAVMAFVRISDEAILERGMIADPDLIILADETLLTDPAAAVLSGMEGASGLFINSDQSASQFPALQPVASLFTYDVTGRTMEILGRAVAVSAGVAAAAARMTGLIEQSVLLRAMSEEFSHLPVSAEEVEKNLQIARDVFEALSVVEIQSRAMPTSTDMAQILRDSVMKATPSVLNAGNAELRHTGNWRVERPVIDPTMCTRCGLCIVECPDGAVSRDEHGYPVVDYDHCKGCMICRQICPIHAIHGEKETRAW